MARLKRNPSKGWTDPQQDSGVEPALQQEGHVEMHKQEGVDPQPHQLETQETPFHLK